MGCTSTHFRGYSWNCQLHCPGPSQYNYQSPSLSSTPPDQPHSQCLPSVALLLSSLLALALLPRALFLLFLSKSWALWWNDDPAYSSGSFTPSCENINTNRLVTLTKRRCIWHMDITIFDFGTANWLWSTPNPFSYTTFIRRYFLFIFASTILDFFSLHCDFNRPQDRSCAMTLIAGVYLSSHSDSTDRRRRHFFFPSPSAMALWHCDIRPRVIHAVIWFGQRRHARQAPDNKNDIKVIGVCDLPTHVVTYLSHRWFPTARYRHKPRKAMGHQGAFGGLESDNISRLNQPDVATKHGIYLIILDVKALLEVPILICGNISSKLI